MRTHSIKSTGALKYGSAIIKGDCQTLDCMCSQQEMASNLTSPGSEEGSKGRKGKKKGRKGRPPLSPGETSPAAGNATNKAASRTAVVSVLIKHEEEEEIHYVHTASKGL